ncbi:MAG: hypothetical protein ABEK50_07925, partial [bacterium]
MSTHERSSLACEFTAIPEKDRNDHAQTAENVFNAIKGYRETPGGYSFELPAQTEIIEEAGAFVARERLCCPFFNFELEVTADEGPVWLTLSGDS